MLQEVVELAGLPVEELSFTISNYFSMGVESRIGRGFDRHRTTSQTLNKMVCKTQIYPAACSLTYLRPPKCRAAFRYLHLYASVSTSEFAHRSCRQTQGLFRADCRPALQGGSRYISVAPFAGDVCCFQRYGIEGFKKTFVTHTKSINQIALALTVNPGTPEEEIIFTTDKTQAQEKQIPLLKSGLQSKAWNSKLSFLDQHFTIDMVILVYLIEIGIMFCFVDLRATQRPPLSLLSTFQASAGEMTYGLHLRSLQRLTRTSRSKGRPR